MNVPSPLTDGTSAGDTASRLAQALDSWRSWSVSLAGRPTVVGTLAGGLTNSSWLIDSSGGQGVLRLNSRQGERLGIDRQREATILTALATLEPALTPAVWRHDLRRGFLVTAFLPGRVWQQADMELPHQRHRLKQLISRYQQVSVDLPVRDYRAYLTRYWQQLQRHGVAVPPLLAARYQACCRALTGWPVGCGKPVLTHHDLTPDNIVDWQGSLYLLDWEYATLGCGAIDQLAFGQDGCPPVMGEWVALINDLWLLLRHSN